MTKVYVSFFFYLSFLEAANVIKEDSTVAYIIGIFIGVILLIALVAYAIYQYNKR